MKNIKRIFGIGIVVAVIGLLVLGGINRTLAQSEDTTDSEYDEFSSDAIVASQPADVQSVPVDMNETVQVNTVSSEVVVVETAVASSLDPSTSLSQEEIDALLFMREEEKLARDVYNYLAVQWGMPVFSNIASSEQTHMDSIVTLIDQYGLTDPASDQSGVFTNQSLQDLYSSLIAQGSISIEEAFKVGAAIEEIDILDLQNRLLLTAHPDIQLVFENLLNGSYNHLNAFATNLFNRTGITYVPQYLSSEA